MNGGVERQRRLATEVRTHQFTESRPVVGDHRIEQRARKSGDVARIEVASLEQVADPVLRPGMRTMTPALSRSGALASRREASCGVQRSG